MRLQAPSVDNCRLEGSLVLNKDQEGKGYTTVQYSSGMYYTIL